MNNPIWDYKDDYYFAQVGDIEINIRAYSDSELSLWMYEYSSDEELVDANYKSIEHLQTAVDEIVGMKIIIPTLTDLLKIKENKNEV